MIISTVIATEADIKDAIEACHSVGNYDITFLKCTSAYPVPLNKANLLNLLDMKERFGVKVGVSDHSMTNTLPVVEKHIILDCNMGGSDSAFSMQPEEFASMVKAIREVEEVLGEVSYPTDSANISGRQFSRSLYIAEDMKAEDILTEQNLRSVRPGYGLAPKYLNEHLGKQVNRDLAKGDRMSLEFINVL